MNLREYHNSKLLSLDENPLFPNKISSGEEFFNFSAGNCENVDVFVWESLIYLGS